MDLRKLAAELLGTAILVFVAVGVATLSFGKWFVGVGFAGTSPAAGVVATALAFGLVLLILVAVIGPVSGAHVNPAVTLGFVVSKRMTLSDAVGYWIAQFIGATVGAALLWVVCKQSDLYTSKTGLGADGFGASSMVHLGAGGAFIVEVILTFIFVLAVLMATAKLNNPVVAGVTIGLALTTVHLVGIPLTGTSVNPARSFGPALFAGGDALKQLWLFIVAPLVGGALAALGYVFLNSSGEAIQTEAN
ncbi:MAG: aquaporin [Actinobacteria bacterium]|nr:aquaporin [Actinomycetota bacterium]